MQNIEIKAKYQDLARAKKIVEKINARRDETYEQVDTYFNVNNGRLKLREISDKMSQLIFYNRPDEAGPKISDYQLYPLENPGLFKDLLKSALGVWKIVEKTREVYWYDEVRIHLDEVHNLGNFLEFEGVISAASQKSSVMKKIDYLQKYFSIDEDDLIHVSYSDLVQSEETETYIRITNKSGS